MACLKLPLAMFTSNSNKQRLSALQPGWYRLQVTLNPLCSSLAFPHTLYFNMFYLLQKKTHGRCYS